MTTSRRREPTLAPIRRAPSAPVRARRRTAALVAATAVLGLTGAAVLAGCGHSGGLAASGSPAPGMPAHPNSPAIGAPAAYVTRAAAGPTGTSGASGATGATGVAASSVTISPRDGTIDARDDTQISFLGAPAADISDVSVVGSQSGNHTGRLEDYVSAPGASFVIDKRFMPGETVTVHAHIGSGAGAGTVSTSFTIAHVYLPSRQAFPITPGTSAQEQHYLSDPGVTPSLVTVTTPPRAGAAPGDFLLAPYQGPGAPGPMILDGKGGLVWFHPLPKGDAATDFKVVQYEGKPVLSWWQGHILSVGFGQGEDFLYDSSYHRVAEIKAGNSMHADLHELRVTPQGQAWIDCFQPIYMNLSQYGGLSKGVITDSVIQEIDIKTGLVMYEWHALGHISPAESYTPPQKRVYPWDFIHVNTISLGPNNTMLLSSRSMWTLFDVDIHTGAVLWRLGGKKSDWKLGPGVKFFYQHDAEWQPNGEISMFDNGASPPMEKQSRGLLLKLDTTAKTVTLVKQFVNTNQTLLASSQGDTQSLAGGDWLMGYGGLPNFTEYDSAGHILFDATLAKGDQSFRTYLQSWTGQPTTRPALAAQSAGTGLLNVEASWNGATTVARWKVLAGSSSSKLATVATATRSGFETKIPVRASGPYVAVQALGSAGQVLATSATVHA